jgi:CheY-like chemotaxis protein
VRKNRPILIVDDEPAIAEAARRHLVARFPGVEVLACTDADVAMQVVSATDVGVLLCDLCMPGHTGTEILAAAHRQNPEVVSLLVTGYATKESLLAAINEGHAWRVIEKPWQPDDLCAQVAAAIENHNRRAAGSTPPPGTPPKKPKIVAPSKPKTIAPPTPRPAGPPPAPAAKRRVRLVVAKPAARPPAAPAWPAPGGRPTFAPPVRPPRVAARYTDLQLIGQGGLGTVYRARDSLLQLPVALKVIAEAYARDPKVLGVLVAAARDAVQLSHPNIVRLHTLDQANGLVYLVMEFIEGATLRRVVSHSGPLKPAAVLAVADACAAALAYAHSRHVHHLDLKPDNLMIDTKHSLRIVDFGLGSLAALAQPQDDVVGTPFYMSPEQACGAAPDPRMDIFSLGVTSHELMTGSMPDHTGETQPAHASEYRPTASEELAPGVREVLNRSFAHEPSDRFETTTDFARALRRVLA